MQMDGHSMKMAKWPAVRAVDYMHHVPFDGGSNQAGCQANRMHGWEEQEG
jgi:hypothetical protein